MPDASLAPLSAFNRLKQVAGRASWSAFREQVAHLRWVDSLGDSAAWLDGIAESKIADFAGEAMAADAGVMRDVAACKRTALLACMVHLARTRARDDLAEMFCKRMASITKLAKGELDEIRERQAQMSEGLIGHYRRVFACLDPRNAGQLDAADVLGLARRKVQDAGGFERELADIEAVAAHHANNYMPLVARHRRRDRATMFAFVRVVELEATSADRSVLDAVAHALAHAHLTRDFIPNHVDGTVPDLSFASEQWQRVFCDRDQPGRLHRRHFEACVFTYLERGDELLDLFDKLLRYADSRARRRVDEQRRKTARQRDELATLARQLSRILVESAATGELAMARIEREIGLDRGRAAAAVPDAALPPLDRQQLDVLLASHSYLRPAVLDLLDALELVAAPVDCALLDAIAATGRARSKLLDDVAIEVLPKAWRAWVLDAGRVRRVRYELGLWFAVRDALRAGRLYRPVSRRYADPTSFLMPIARWQDDRDELAVHSAGPSTPPNAWRSLKQSSVRSYSDCRRRSTPATACACIAATSSSSPSQQTPSTPMLNGSPASSAPACRGWSSPSCCSKSTHGHSSART